MTDLIKKLSKKYYSALAWANETGSTKLTSRISDARKAGHIFKVRAKPAKNGRVFFEYKYIGKSKVGKVA